MRVDFDIGVMVDLKVEVDLNLGLDLVVELGPFDHDLT